MSSGRGTFVTGTDTGVGKTVVAAALLRALAASGTTAVGMKPVAAGIGAHETVHADVAALAAASTVDAPLADRNPYAFTAAIAPHLAASSAGVAIELDVIAAAFDRLAARAEAVVVEGAGGALVPLSARQDMLDIPARLDIPVLLVVGLRLGCLNHAFLTAIAIRSRGLRCAGWVANVLEPSMPRVDENIAALVARLASPCLATLRHGSAESFGATALAQMGFDAP